jgi:hypothetical protein
MVVIVLVLTNIRKKIPIQGTNVCLDTPEAIELWIAERKKRFPTQANIEEKKRKREEALARGQISVDDPGLLGLNKRRKMEMQNGSMNDRGCGRGRGIGRVRGRGRGRGNGSFRSNNKMMMGDNPENVTPINGDGEQKTKAMTSTSPTSETPSGTLPLASYSSSDSDSDDGPPETVSSRLIAITETQDVHVNHSDISAAPQEAECIPETAKPPGISIDEQRGQTRPIQKSVTRQPKGPVNNPFAARPYLLRNVRTAFSLTRCFLI